MYRVFPLIPDCCINSRSIGDSIDRGFCGVTVGHSIVNDRAHLANSYSKTGYRKRESCRTFFGMIESRRDNGDTAGTSEYRSFLRSNFSDATLPMMHPHSHSSRRRLSRLHPVPPSLFLFLSLFFASPFAYLVCRGSRPPGEIHRPPELFPRETRGPQFLLRLHFHIRFWIAKTNNDLNAIGF